MAFTLRKEKDDTAPSGEKRSRLRLPGGAKYVLFIGDEGAILIYLNGSEVFSRQFIPDTEAKNLAEFRQALMDDPDAPLLVVIDSMDQSYAQQTLPPVSRLSINKLIKRRLDRDFGPDIVKGSLLLGREITGRKDWNFLMVSLDKSPQMLLWFDFVTRLPNRLQGIYLLSVETELLLKRLERSLGIPKSGTGAEWKFFVSHNKVGGFRQVILRNGRIIFTRMAQLPTGLTIEGVGANIEREMLGTLEYMKRQSFDPASGLDVYIVAGNDTVKPVVDAAKLEASSLQILSPYEAAQHLGIEGATQPSDQYGDVVLAASIGASRRHILTLSLPTARYLAKFYLMLNFQRAAAALAVASLLICCGIDIYDIIVAHNAANALAIQKTSAQADLDAQRAIVTKANVDVNATNDMSDLYQRLLDANQTPLPVIEALEAIPISPVRIKDLSWDVKESKDAAHGGRSGAKMTLALTLEFPATPAQQADSLHALAKTTLENFKDAFKGYQVVYPSLPAELSDNKVEEIRFDARAKADIKPVSALLNITGPAMSASVSK